jgi:hypothetical protein
MVGANEAFVAVDARGALRAVDGGLAEREEGGLDEAGVGVSARLSGASRELHGDCSWDALTPGSHGGATR